MPVIYLLLDSKKNGGIETHVLQLAQGLKDYRQQVVVIFLQDYGDHPLKVALANSGIRYLVLDGSFRELKSLIHQTKPSVIHTHGYKAGILGRLCGLLCKAPVVSTFHAGEVPKGKLAFYDWLDRYTAFIAKQIFTVSPQISERIIFNNKVFDNFINTKNINDSYGDEIAFVGRVSEEKGPDHFLLLAQRFSEVTFHLYGDGPLMAEISKKAPINVCFHGQQNDMTMIWARIGLLIMPSRFEGLPMAALEAMGRSIPVLAYKVGALPKLISSRKNGWLATPGNIDELEQHLQKWLCINALTKKTFKQSAKECIENGFSSAVALPKLIATYNQISR